MNHERWRGMSLDQRYRSLYGDPRPVEEPVAAAPSLWSALRDVPLSDEARATFRRGEARKQLNAALAEQQAEEARQRREFSNHVVRSTAIGQLLVGGHDG